MLGRDMDDLPDFDINLTEGTIEKREAETVLKLKVKAEAKELIFMEKKDTFNKIITSFPEPGEYYHIVNNAKYDFYTILPCIIDRRGPIEDCYVSTWTMNRNNTLDIMKQLDGGKIKNIGVLTGLFFKRRETAVYSQLMTGLLKRGQRFVAFKNHCKVLLAKTKNDYLVIEGSANFTSNPRLEQYVFTNNKKLFEFHKQWMEKFLNER